MKAIAWGLIILQVLGMLSTSISGIDALRASFDNGFLSGVFFWLGYLLFGIVGVTMLIIGKHNSAYALVTGGMIFLIVQLLIIMALPGFVDAYSVRFFSIGQFIRDIFILLWVLRYGFLGVLLTVYGWTQLKD